MSEVQITINQPPFKSRADWPRHFRWHTSDETICFASPEATVVCRSGMDWDYEECLDPVSGWLAMFDQTSELAELRDFRDTVRTIACPQSSAAEIVDSFKSLAKQLREVEAERDRLREQVAALNKIVSLREATPHE